MFILRNITFTTARVENDASLNKTVGILDQLENLNLTDLPAEYLANLVRLLAAMCRRDNRQIQTDISLIAQLDRDACDLANTHDILDTVRRHNEYLMARINEYKEEENEHKKGDRNDGGE